MGKFKYIKADIFSRGIGIFIGSRKECADFVEKAYGHNESLIKAVKEDVGDESASGSTYEDECGQTLIWMPVFPKTPQQMGILAHEILHAVFAMLNYINVEYVYNGANETYAYLMGFFMKKALTEKGYKNV